MISKTKKGYSVQIPHKGKTKTIKLKPHHRNPFRKRHYAFLIACLILCFFLLMLGISIEQQAVKNSESVKEYLSSLFEKKSTESQAIKSSLGFSLNYDPEVLFAAGIDSKEGNLYTSNELDTERPYQVIKLTSFTSRGEENYSNFTLDYSKDGSDISEQKMIEEGIDLNSSSLIKLSTSDSVVDAVKFTKSEWILSPKKPAYSKLASYFTTYTGKVNQGTLTIKISKGLSNNTNLFNPVIDSLKFSPSETAFAPSKDIESKISYQRSFLETIGFSNIALAASNKQNASASELNGAKYSPAVVRIYNVYCLDINLLNRPYLKNVCSGLSGSGFIVSSDGYVATNGHVASTSAKELAIYHALFNLTRGNLTYLEILGNVAGIQDSDFSGLTDETTIVSRVVDKLYSIPESSFTTPNSVVNLLVGLNNSTPDIKKLEGTTKARKVFPENENIRSAKVVASDFRLIDGITGFKASDVAILKINNTDLPVVNLGSIEDVTQGSGLTIMGFPAVATANGLVNADQSKVTLTSGKVASIKNAKGSVKKLIETDTTIGSGNSGGPVLSEAGKVVGLATYSVDQSGTGGGVFNYIRDIKDLKDLASSKSITFNAQSKTQAEWDKGLDNFYKSKYSKAIKSFDKVIEIFPQHTSAVEFTRIAQAHIDKGEDVRDWPILAGIAVLVVLSLIGVGVAVFLIIRHKKKHEIYNDHFATNQSPVTPQVFGQQPNPQSFQQMPAINPQPQNFQPTQAPAPSLLNQNPQTNGVDSYNAEHTNSTQSPPQ